MVAIVRSALPCLSYSYSDLIELSRAGFSSRLLFSVITSLLLMTNFCFQSVRVAGLHFRLIVAFLAVHGSVLTTPSFVTFYDFVTRLFVAGAFVVCTKFDSVGLSFYSCPTFSSTVVLYVCIYMFFVRFDSVSIHSFTFFGRLVWWFGYPMSLRLVKAPVWIFCMMRKRLISIVLINFQSILIYQATY